MKTVVFLLTCIFSLNIITADLVAHRYHGDRYCAKLKDGRVVVIHDGAEINSSVTLNNGTVIKPDGVVIEENGNRFTMEPGDCIDREGNKTRPKSKTK